MQNCLSKESLLSSRKEQNPAKNKSVFLTMILKKKKEFRIHCQIMFSREQELGYQCLCSGIHQMSEMEGVAAGIL